MRARRDLSLREQALSGGAYLVGREALGIIIRLGGMVAVTRLIGPAAYGSYAGPLVMVLLVASVAMGGVDVYLLRSPVEPSKTALDVSFTWLALTACFLTILVLGATFGLVDRLLPESFVWPFRWLLLSIPINVLWMPARARLERSFRYRRLAVVELSSDMLFLVVAVPLAAAGAGVWAPVAGYCAGQVALLVGACVLADYVPRPAWSAEQVRAMSRYGLGYATSIWVYRARDLVNPLLVGRVMGPEAVGYIAMAIRVADTLSFVKRATWRLSIVALGRVQAESNKLRAVAEEGMTIQVFASGSVLGAFALVAPSVVTWTLGERWEPVVTVYSFVAFAYIMNSAFNMHSSCLYVLRRNALVTKFHVLHVALLAVVTVALVPHVGLAAYGWAEVAAASAYLVLMRDVHRLFVVRYGSALLWLGAFVPLLAAPWLSASVRPALLVAPLIAVATSSGRRQVLYYADVFRRYSSGDRVAEQT